MVQKNKRGISPVVATVMLVLISIIAVGLIAGFIIPMIKNALEGGTSCFELLEHAKISSSDYTCYNSSNSVVSLKIERSFEEIEIKGFVVSLLVGGDLVRYDLIDGKTETNVRMKTGETILEIPGGGESKTYIFSSITEDCTKAKLGIINEVEKICEIGTYNVPDCL